MKNFFLFLFLFAGISVYGQEWFSKHQQAEETDGYIITIAGDTIRGKILYDYPVIMQKRISFVGKDNSGTVVYQPKDIRGYSSENIIWESVLVNMATYNGPIKFNRFGILYSGSGPIHLLRIFTEKDKLGKNITSTKAEIMYKGITLSQEEKSFDNLYIMKQESPAEDVNSKEFRHDFINNISGLVSDNKELTAKIQAKEYGFNDLLKIVEEYNKWFMEQRYNRTR
jgi:hypothetical protein